MTEPSAPTPPRSQDDPQHEPIEVIHFTETYGPPIHHYILWGLVIAAFTLGVGHLVRKAYFPPPPPAAERPTSLTFEVHSTADSVIVKNTTSVTLADAKALIVTEPNRRYGFHVTNVASGGEIKVAYTSFRDEQGYPLAPESLTPDSKLTLEAFGMKAEKPLTLPPAATPAPAASGK